MKEQLEKYLHRYVDLTESEITLFFNCLTVKKLKKKEFLLREGQTCRHHFFILNGLVRFFYIDEKGAEQITQFGLENWWVTNMESLVETTASELYIQAVEQTTVLCLNKDKLDDLYVKIPKLERFFRIIAEKTLIAIQRKADFFMKKGSKERYQFLMNQLPDFAQRVPQYMIASYLEITPEYLSELRKMCS